MEVNMKRYTKWLSVSLALIMLLTLLPGCGKNPTGNGAQREHAFALAAEARAGDVMNLGGNVQGL